MTQIHPIIYTQPSEVRMGDPREDHIIVGNWWDGFNPLKRHRLNMALDTIVPKIIGIDYAKGDSVSVVGPTVFVKKTSGMGKSSALSQWVKT